MTSSQSGKKKKLNYNIKVNKVHVQESGFYEDSSVLYILLVIVISTVVGFLNAHHVSTLFENDRHFSHLSNLEREMTFRTEMGLYYSYFKTIVEADSLGEGAYQLYRNNLTEFPLVINTLKRFNLYPELLARSLYRSLDQLGLLSQQDLPGLGDDDEGPVPPDQTVHQLVAVRVLGLHDPDEAVPWRPERGGEGVDLVGEDGAVVVLVLHEDLHLGPGRLLADWVVGGQPQCDPLLLLAVQGLVGEEGEVSRVVVVVARHHQELSPVVGRVDCQL